MEAEGVHGIGWLESRGFSGKSAGMAIDLQEYCGDRTRNYNVNAGIDFIRVDYRFKMF